MRPYLLVTLIGFTLLTLCITLTICRMSLIRRNTACFIVLSSPLLLILLRWMGKSDPYLVAFYVIMLNVRGHSWATAALALLMVTAHREIGSIMLVGGLILGQIAAFPVVFGALVGHSIVWGYQSMLDTKPFSRVSFAIYIMHTSAWKTNPISHLILGPGWFWIFIARLVNCSDAPRVLVTLAMCFVAAVATADYTRVFILCAVPLIAYAADRISKEVMQGQGSIRWPALFAVQAQIEFGDHVRDSLWFSN